MIGWYVHHHGRGHVHRAATIAARLRTPVVGLSTLPAPDGWPGEWVPLPPDVDGSVPRDPTARGVLHWAPLGHPGLRDRTALISRVLARPELRLVVVDVSVEVTLLARLSGLPVAVMAQPGDRTDRPHRTAYDLAETLLAPWSSAGPPLPARGVHVGAISRFDGREPPPPPGRRRVLVLWGAGGIDVTPDDLRAAAAATPDWAWEVVGPAQESAGPANLRWRGWCDDVWTALCDADVVVTHGGQNAVAEVAAARRAAVVVSQVRPHGEQDATALALHRAGIAVGRSRWPAAGRWPSVLDEAVARGGEGWKQWSSGDGAARAAAVLDDLAAR
ncbi:MAG: glycosyl transferase [Pseudonocardia sp.]|uniref:glycosyltransferase n=1 Tax=Pseudonocardia sp. TaxID=60912 RepID=UPI001AC9A180|nr:glycosyltransferase [Pseudonocardia sp.]MBN9102958.1 glycosyl transferase [Pseudonocardia sp.]